MANKFTTALNHRQPVPAAGTSASRARLKHIGGYFDPRTSTQLRHLAVTENRSVQALLAEAIDLLFQARGKDAGLAKQGHK